MSVWKNVKLNYLPDSEMRKLGFQDMCDSMWVYVKDINTLLTNRYNLRYSFNLFVDKDTQKFKLEIINADTGNIYDKVDSYVTNEDIAINKFLEGELNRFKNAGLITILEDKMINE